MGGGGRDSRQVARLKDRIIRIFFSFFFLSVPRHNNFHDALRKSFLYIFLFFFSLLFPHIFFFSKLFHHVFCIPTKYRTSFSFYTAFYFFFFFQIPYIEYYSAMLEVLYCFTYVSDRNSDSFRSLRLLFLIPCISHYRPAIAV